MKAGRVFFLDPSLGPASGHHNIVAANYRVLLGGRESVFVGHRGSTVERAVFVHKLEQAFRISRYARAWVGHPLLARALHLAARLRPAAKRRSLPRAPKAAIADGLSVEAYARLFSGLRAGAAIDALDCRPGDDLVVLGVDPAVITAMHQRRGHFASIGVRLHLVFMYPEEDFVGPRTDPAYWTIVRDCAAAGAKLYAELDLHAAAIAARTGASVTTQTTPVRLSQLPPPPEGPFTVAVLGAGRWDKAFDALPAIVAASAPALAFRIQRPVPGVGLERYTRQLAAEPNVTVLPHDLSSARFEAELARAHVFLLAYDQKRYALRNSGVLVDALVGGRPFVCTEGTALARGIIDGNGIAAEGVSGIAMALSNAMETYPDLIAAAQRVSVRMGEQIRDGSLLRALRGE